MKKIYSLFFLAALALFFSFLTPAKSQTMATPTNGLLHAANTVLANAEIPGIIGIDSTGSVAVRPTAPNQSLNVYNSSGSFAGTLQERDGVVNYSGCNVIGTNGGPQ